MKTCHQLVTPCSQWNKQKQAVFTADFQALKHSSSMASFSFSVKRVTPKSYRSLLSLTPPQQTLRTVKPNFNHFTSDESTFCWNSLFAAASKSSVAFNLGANIVLQADTEFKIEVGNFSGGRGRRHLLAAEAVGGVKQRRGTEEPFAGVPRD